MANKPVKTFRAGAITASVWENEVEDGSFLTVTLSRNYKDKNDEWKQSNTLRINDMPKARMVLQKAYEYCAMSGNVPEKGE